MLIAKSQALWSVVFFNEQACLKLGKERGQLMETRLMTFVNRLAVVPNAGIQRAH